MMNPVLVALDLPEAAAALEVADLVAPHVGGFKIGLELLMAEGPAVIDAVTALGLPVFADAKLHDIPNTVRAAARELGSHGARWVSAHAGGGRRMLTAAVEGLRQGAGGRDAGVLAITVLTSLDAEALNEVGVSGTVGDQVRRLVVLASETGCEGVVCSVHELGLVKSASRRLLRVTPGIRPPGSEHHDQVRVASLEDAISEGADYVVVGRTIVGADRPDAAASRLAAAAVRTGDRAGLRSEGELSSP